MSPEQCRAARAWLEWSQGRLATEAGVGLSTVKGFEAGKRTIGATLAAMRVALEKVGVTFVDGESSGITGPKTIGGPRDG
ncbi:XRE family transcriptional regulator [Lichenihabitans sp. Uapishka_5]|nr:XRE family transcriptional regulator [Lichenihabitans sp. Uapishka_5]